MRRQRHRSSRSLARAPYPPPPAARPRGPLPRWTEPGGSPGRNPLPERFDPAWLCLRPPLRVRRDRGPTTTPPEKPEAPVRKARGRGQWVEPQRRPSTASPFPEHGTQRLRAGRPAGTRGPADCTSGGGSRASGQARIAPVRHFRLRPVPLKRPSHGRETLGDIKAEDCREPGDVCVSRSRKQSHPPCYGCEGQKHGGAEGLEGGDPGVPGVVTLELAVPAAQQGRMEAQAPPW
ncbi:proteasome assembly chaperone 3 isoform X1 [Manis javanica]|uniref:proteasome assembly chaperone 3 isoform X1 n=1 Tax=Manis javanica TaxID=9974 RepID=UPI003C6D6F7E